MIFNKDVVLADTEWLAHMNFEVFCDPITKKKIPVNPETAYLFSFVGHPHPRLNFTLRDLFVSKEEAKGLITNTPFVAGSSTGAVFTCMNGNGGNHLSGDTLSAWPFAGAFGSEKCNTTSPHILLAIRVDALTISIGGPEFIILKKEQPCLVKN